MSRPVISRFVTRLERLVREACADGLALVVDADSMAIRVMARDRLDADDLRTEGERVGVDGACGGHGSGFHVATAYPATPPKTRAQEAAADMRERAAKLAEGRGEIILAGEIRALPLEEAFIADPSLLPKKRPGPRPGDGELPEEEA